MGFVGYVGSEGQTVPTVVTSFTETVREVERSPQGPSMAMSTRAELLPREGPGYRRGRQCKPATRRMDIYKQQGWKSCHRYPT